MSQNICMGGFFIYLLFCASAKRRSKRNLFLKPTEFFLLHFSLMICRLIGIIGFLQVYIKFLTTSFSLNCSVAEDDERHVAMVAAATYGDGGDRFKPGHPCHR